MLREFLRDWVLPDFQGPGIDGFDHPSFPRVYNELNAGFPGSVCEPARYMAHNKSGHASRTAHPLSVCFGGQQIQDLPASSWRADWRFAELKAPERKVGLLLNFAPVPRVKRLPSGMKKRKACVAPRQSAADIVFRAMGKRNIPRQAWVWLLL